MKAARFIPLIQTFLLVIAFVALCFAGAKIERLEKRAQLESLAPNAWVLETNVGSSSDNYSYAFLRGIFGTFNSYHYIPDNLYTNLQSRYDALSDNYTRLQKQYDALSENYTWLKEHPNYVASEIEKTITITVTSNITPRPFATVAEVENWASAHSLPLILIADSDGMVNFNNPKPNSLFDCDDYAKNYQALALQDGFIINLCPVVNGGVLNHQVTSVWNLHIGCWVQIGNIYYYIEPCPTNPNPYKLIRITEAD